MWRIRHNHQKENDDGLEYIVKKANEFSRTCEWILALEIYYQARFIKMKGKWIGTYGEKGEPVDSNKVDEEVDTSQDP